MHYNAELRVRELTQNIYDIGDDIAEAIDHVAQAVRDWDDELAADCLDELRDIVDEARSEVRPDLSELNGLRQAFISGIRAGHMSASFPHPGRTLTFLHPSTAGTAEDAGAAHGAGDDRADKPARPGTMASTAAWRLWMRSEAERILADLTELEEWVVEQTRLALEAQSVLLPQAYLKAYRVAEGLVEQWRDIADLQPSVSYSMRGEAPPEFLTERARIDAIVSKLQRRRRDAVV